MPASRRKSLPDNLDPLVDTLSNVVGILVVVVALTQLQVGNALERLLELDASRLPGARIESTALERRHDELAERLTRARERKAIVLARSSGDVADAILAAQKNLALLSEQPKPTSPRPTRSTDALERELEAKTRELALQKTALQRREDYVAEIERVPKELVARLPDPEIVTGEEAWILCRYKRCYLADRTRLVEAGSRAIGHALITGSGPRAIRPDEYESVAHQFRKRDVGDGNFRWRIVPGPETVAQVEWRSQDPGIERTRLASSPELAAWLRARSPDRDFIRFQVWNDSFEVYLEARQVIEAAGFRAGWVGHPADRELELVLTFGPAPEPIGPVEID